jgi:hypothetical protein
VPFEVGPVKTRRTLPEVGLDDELDVAGTLTVEVELQLVHNLAAVIVH